MALLSVIAEIMIEPITTIIIMLVVVVIVIEPTATFKATSEDSVTYTISLATEWIMGL